MPEQHEGTERHDGTEQHATPRRPEGSRLGRRRLLRAGLGAGGALATVRLLPGGTAWAAPARDHEFGTAQYDGLWPSSHAGLRAGTAAQTWPDWTRYARIADGTFNEPADMQSAVDALKAQEVSVIELDTLLSDWLTDAQFAAHMAEVKQFTGLAHAAGLKVVMYYPSLELISPGGEKGRSFYKNDQGKNWVQRDLAGKPNVFYGSVVVWVDPGDESVWLSPNSPWRDYYLNRIKGVAATGVDGIWPDVPIYFDGVLSWCDASTWGAAAFKADTGLALPKAANFADPVFRRYVEWRHRNLLRFQLDIADAGRSVNPDLVTFVETVSMDYRYATSIGLDGGYLRQAPGAVSQVWEVDILGNYDGMRHATAADWVCLISMYKYARAASGTKPAWAFSYGWQADDASLVMSQLIAAGCNPYEVKTPFKNDTVDAAMRTRMYRFVRTNQTRLYDPVSIARVGVYHSAPSRDYVSPGEGNGMYVNATAPAGIADWWGGDDPGMSCASLPWLGEFRGTVKALVYAHVPFDTVPSPGLTADDLARFKVLLLPNLQAVSDSEAALLRGFVAAGGTIVITGPAPTALDELGGQRTEFALSDVLGLRRADPLPATRQNSYGSGSCWYVKALPGLSYLTKTDQASADQLLTAVRQSAPPEVTLAGDRRIFLDARRLGSDTVVHLVNFTNFGDTPAAFRSAPANCTLSWALPAGASVSAVTVASPDGTDPAPKAVPYTVTGGTVSVPLTVAQYSVVTITVGQAV
ncbi:hypothetical protein ACFVVA_34535 [Kitasatospora sp. NPDC058048]|uniref:hypothetical protein n=1 Tax=Kitasatospora sp. NPDC058048 TaxID=3346313 RepID=UPI0036DDD705